jgi:2-polyprenyl-3-methyl-5-hydroxy-6-metoxy-1,4-benzoquinol methylase
MNNKNTELLEKTLSRPELHNQWVERYYSGKNNQFYELAFDYIIRKINLKKGSHFLDAGCGNGVHSIRLAKREFNVTASDFSTEALKLCSDNVKNSGYSNKMTIRKENLLELTFPSGNFDGVLCWGVLMHIPEVGKAISELCRVVKPGGYLILCELSVSSMENRVRGILKKILRMKNTRDDNTERGLECWTETEAGVFLIRKTNMNWLVKEAGKYNLKLIDRKAAQFTELYSWTSSTFLKYIIQSFNEIWFKYVKYAAPSLAQILIFRKNEDQ